MKAHLREMLDPILDILLPEIASCARATSDAVLLLQKSFQQSGILQPSCLCDISPEGEHEGML